MNTPSCITKTIRPGTQWHVEGTLLVADKPTLQGTCWGCELYTAPYLSRQTNCTATIPGCKNVVWKIADD